MKEIRDFQGNACLAKYNKGNLHMMVQKCSVPYQRERAENVHGARNLDSYL